MEEAINEVFDLAVKEVSDSSGPPYEKTLAHFIEEGLDVIGPRATVHCSAKDKKAATSAIRKLDAGKDSLAIGEKSIDTIGGVILTTTDGSVKFDNTFEARLERTRPSLRKEVAGLLTSAPN